MAEKAAKFKKGQQVSWDSNGRGNWKTKTGKVVAVVPANVNPVKSIVPELTAKLGDCHVLFGGLGTRGVESYVVAVHPALGSNARPKLYWPRSGLRAA